ncbi:DNA/RNA non-specific endonuclease [Phanerochaete sordida]|uniref:Endonuclease n=1 Tax=Phanerochaete sordida TaxID=48140 RepID=A0A9P3LAH9_9APHY|nr:DNA/RNA non-specific endonuclease [Phanerochaete sordida]
MPSSTILHAACFAVGAIVGGGVATALSRSNAPQRPVAVPVPTSESVRQPIVQVHPTGMPQLSQPGTLVKAESQLLKYGHPGPISDLLVRKAYVAAYDRRLRHPAWTAEHLTLASLGKSPLEARPSAEETGDRSKSQFVEDESVPAMFRAKLADYFRSGYDRGHMVPAADAKISQEAMDETFLLTNIAPQVGAGFNRHYWAYLEDWCRRLTGNFADVYVFTVPLYLPKLDGDGKWRVHYEVIGKPPSIAVPTHFAKVVLTTRPSSPSTPNVPEISTGAFVLPNAEIPDQAPLENFVVPIEAVERAAGLTFFSEEIKARSKHICKTTKCEVIVRRFDDAQKNARKAIAAPK